MIEMFLKLLGINLVRRRSICSINTNDPVLRNKLQNILNFDYQIAITQIMRHLRAMEDYGTQEIILNVFNTEIQSGCIKDNNVSSIFKCKWIE